MSADVCSRCRRSCEGPADFIGWELGDGSEMICPGCITGAEQQALDEDDMAFMSYLPPDVYAEAYAIVCDLLEAFRAGVSDPEEHREFRVTSAEARAFANEVMRACWRTTDPPTHDAEWLEAAERYLEGPPDSR